MGDLDTPTNICFFCFNKEFNNPKQPNFQAKSNISSAAINQKIGQNPSVLMANSTVANLETVVDPSWYMDSGATNHVTTNSNFLSSSFEYSGNEKAIVGNGSQLNISRLGNVVLKSNNSFL